ncbi:hypothetical protein [Sphingomonas sp.]|uniref:hypothetical protein n=1 Tax=Sphingomonas sp. TaxID=28214 RepID=UPI00307FBE75
MARAVIYDDDGNIIQVTEGAAENIAATAITLGAQPLPIPSGPLAEDLYLDTTHKVVGGVILER